MSPLIPSILGLAVLVLAACSTAAPLATPTAPSEVGWGDGTGTVLPSGTLQLFPSAQPSPDWTLVEAPGWAYVPGFLLRLPPGWELNELQGIDSYVGEVVGDNVRLEFDYGAHSWPLDPAEDPERVYAVAYEGIGGVEAKLVIPTGDSGGYTGIYFENLGGQSLNLLGQDLTPEQQQTAFAIFRSIRSLGQSGSTTDPDDVTLEGPGVIRHDWDHTPLINRVRKIIQGTRVDGVCVYTYRMYSGPNNPPKKIQRTLASNPDTCEELVEEGTLAYPAGNEPEDAAMESVTAIPREQAASLGVELVAIDSHWDNNGIALWWEGIDIEAKLDAYGLSDYYNAVSPASAAALDSALAEPQKAHRPVFAYYWTPAPLMAVYDWHVLEEPPYGAECWQEVSRAADADGGSPSAQACAYESIPIDKLAHAGLQKKAPDVFAMIEKMIVGLEPLNTTMAWAIENSVEDWDKAAIYYLRNYEDRWRTWVTPDAHDKIAAALNKTS